MGEPIIECGLCRLRPLTLRDAEALVRHADNPKIAANLRDRFPNPYTYEDAQKFLAAVVEQDDSSPEFVLAIEVDGEAVGGIGIVRGVDIERISAELGYWLSEDYWGRGIATNAIQHFAPWVMERFGLLRLHADTFHDNPASARVLEKAGFKKESVRRRAAIKNGDVKDLNVYVMLK